MVLALSALALAGGCDPGDFNSALDKAPVQYISAPSGFGSNVGRTLLPLAPPADKPKMAARLLFAGTDKPSLAVADFDGDGKAQVQTATSDDLGALGLSADQSQGQGGVSSAAWLNGAGATGTILLGIPNFVSPQGRGLPSGRVAFLKLVGDAGKVDFESAQIPADGPVTENHFGLAVASGRVTQTAADEAIVVSDSVVHVLGVTTGVAGSTTCTGSLPTPPDLHRSLAVADFVAGGNMEIAVGLPVKGGTGQVFKVQYGINPATPTAPAGLFCVSKQGVPNPAGNPAVGGFGTALVAVPDMNGDGLAELVVGAPPNQVYLLYSDGSAPKVFTKVKLNPISGKPELDPNTGKPEPDNDSEFGQRVALVDIDGDGIKELAVTALQASVGGTPKAGQVLVYKLSGPSADGSTPIAVVYDSNPIANTGFFGIGLADLEFDSVRVCPSHKDGGQQDKHLLVVGDDLGIFTFFRFAGIADPTTAITRDDPRCFAQ
jgi:FG-GAP repeat.